MRKTIFILAILAGCFLPLSARAQTQTNVTATIVDPVGIPYANGTVSVQLVPSGTNPTVNGGSILGTLNGSTDATGSFNISLWPNASISPAGTKWQFTVCVSPGVQPPLGTGGQCSTPPAVVTIAGASQSLSATLSAVAPKLTNITLGGGSVTNVTGSAPITSTGGATPVIGCATCNTSAATIAGTVTASRIPYASAGNTLADIAGSAVTGGTGAIALTAGADTTTPLAINGHSATQSVPLLDINDNSGGSAVSPLSVRGKGLGSFTPGGVPALSNFQVDTAAAGGYGWVLTNRAASGSAGVLSSLGASVADTGVGSICGGNVVGDASGNFGCLQFGLNAGLQLVTALVGPAGSLNTVDFTVQNQAAGSTADLLDIKNSGGLVADFDKSGNLVVAGTGGVTASAGPVVAGSDGVHAGDTTQVANNTLPPIVPSSYNTVGPTLPYTAWEDQPANSTSGGPAAHSIKVYPAVGGVPLSSQWLFTAISNCPDTVGNHLNYTQSTDLFSCGTTSSGTSTAVSCGVLNTTSCVITGFGSTSGTATVTWPAVASTVTNPLAFSNGIQLPIGACATPSLSFAGFLSYGIYFNNTVGMTSCAAGIPVMAIYGTPGVSLANNAPLIWGTGAPATGGDTGISRGGIGIVDIGNSTAGDTSGTIDAAKYLTSTNCSSSASPAVCGSASAGNAALPTNAVSSSIQINTTAVTANSQIFYATDDTLGTKLGVTCNSTVATLVGGLTVSARNAGVSFTISNNVAVVTNPLCISYHIIN